MYEIGEKENEDNSDAEEDGKLGEVATVSESSQAVAVQYPSILFRTIGEITHAEAEEEVGE